MVRGRRTPSIEGTVGVSSFRTGMATRSLFALALLAALAIWLALMFVPSLLGSDSTLWRIVHDRCVPHFVRGDGPAPCRAVDLRAGVENGYAVLKDLRGKAQHLLIPTANITGIESPELLRPGGMNYFAQAWTARTFVEEHLRHPLARWDVSLTVNSQLRRSQGQLHIHIDCVRQDVRDALRRLAPSIGDRWAPLDELLVGRQYRALRVLGDVLGDTDPFRLLATDEDAHSAMGEHSLVVVGADFGDQGPGFVILNGSVTSRIGEASNGEILQDHSCGLNPDLFTTP